MFFSRLEIGQEKAQRSNHFISRKLFQKGQMAILVQEWETVTPIVTSQTTCHALSIFEPATLKSKRTDYFSVTSLDTLEFDIFPKKQ
jgi:hypothetical protein